MSIFFIIAQAIGLLAFTSGWLRGGHVERFGAGVLLCDYAVTGLASGTAGERTVVAASAFVVATVFVWLSLRSGRWWPFVTAAALVLCVMVFFLEWLNPGLSSYAAVSAQLGLWIVAYLALLAGVGERWLAGEDAVSPAAAWRRHSAT